MRKRFIAALTAVFFLSIFCATDTYALYSRCSIKKPVVTSENIVKTSVAKSKISVKEVAIKVAESENSVTIPSLNPDVTKESEKKTEVKAEPRTSSIKKTEVKVSTQNAGSKPDAIKKSPQKSTKSAAQNSNSSKVVSSVKRVASADTSVSRGSRSASAAQKVVDYAETFVGIPYVYGGSTPRGFDCSGFTCYVFAHFGINLPRTAADQLSVGVPVSRSELKPGDLLLFGNPVHHVGIYVGNNMYIHSPQTGDHIRIQVLNRFTYARRLIN